jgi:hypothetical protein
LSLVVSRDLRPFFGAVRDQGSRPTCIAFALSDAHAAARGAFTLLAITRKRLFLDRRGGSWGKVVQLKAQVIQVVVGHRMDEKLIDDRLEVSE